MPYKEGPRSYKSAVRCSAAFLYAIPFGGIRRLDERWNSRCVGRGEREATAFSFTSTTLSRPLGKIICLMYLRKKNINLISINFSRMPINIDLNGLKYSFKPNEYLFPEELIIIN